MDSHEKWIKEIKLARLCEQLQIGVDQLEQGQGITIESKKGLDRLFDAVRDNAKLSG